jgi:hypothetical protein
MIVRGLVLAIALSWCAPAWSEDAKGAFERFREGKSVRVIAPIFSQLLASSLPQGFAPVSFEKTKGPIYTRESVLTGESVENWSQMVTNSGLKNLASKPDVTARTFLNSMAEAFRRACPFSFSTKGLNASSISGFDAAVAVISCGTSPGTAGKTSETALIAVIKGQADFYTVQWAERATPSHAPIPIDLKKWTDRFKALGPIRLCPIVPGEKAPYPSCVGDGQKKPA